jgi:hypothetical protein
MFNPGQLLIISHTCFILHHSPKSTFIQPHGHIGTYIGIIDCEKPTSFLLNNDKTTGHHIMRIFQTTCKEKKGLNICCIHHTPYQQRIIYSDPKLIEGMFTYKEKASCS